MIDREELKSFLGRGENHAEGIFIDPKELVFEENVKMNCFYCGKYKNNWRCPPHLPDIDYKAMVKEFDAGLFVYYRYVIDENTDYGSVREESGIMLHRKLLSLEKWMWNRNCSNAVSFIGGSCRLCRDGCGKEKCNNPYMSRSPLEAIGVNVVKSAGKYGIRIRFPADQVLMRLGLLLWQEPEE